MPSIILSFVLLAALVNGLAFNLPRQTSDAEIYSSSLIWAPETTPGPKSPPHELLRRDAVEVFTRIWADNVCGYKDGIQSSSYACDDTLICVLQLPGSSDDYGHIGCMELDESTVGQLQSHTSCVSWAALGDDSRCDESCQRDSRNLLCTDSNFAYCNSYLFSEAAAELLTCESEPLEGWVTVNLFVQDDLTAPERSFSSAEFALASTITQISSFVETHFVQPPVTVILSQSAGSSTTPISATSSEASPKAKSTSDKSSPPIGAIVGGVIGGVALLALIGIAIFVIRKHYNKRSFSSQTALMGTAAAYKDTPTPPGSNIGEGKSYADGPDPNLKCEMDATSSPHIPESELDATSPLKSARNSTHVPDSDREYRYTAYHAVPTEPPHENQNQMLRPVSQITRASVSPLSVAGSEWLPDSPARMSMCGSVNGVRTSMVEQVDIAEVEGSAVPPKVLAQAPSINVDGVPMTSQGAEGGGRGGSEEVDLGALPPLPASTPSSPLHGT